MDGGLADEGLASMTLTNVTISGNSSDCHGGGIYMFHDSATMNDVTISGNAAFASGGGIDNNGGTLTMSDAAIPGNSADSGGGIYFNTSSSTLTKLADVVITGNYALWGGGITSNGPLTLFDATISGNFATDGAGLLNFDLNDEADLTDCTISGNVSDNLGLGGGIYNFGTLAISYSTISGNYAGNGGGFYNERNNGANGGSKATLTDVTISGNSADSGGGGIDNHGAVTLTNTTISGNTAHTGGDIENDGAATLDNTIVSNGGNGGDIALGQGASVVVSGSDNLIDNAASAGGFKNGINGNLVGVNPLLAPLGNYGGPTQTMALLPGSPAIDAGDTALAVNPQGNPLSTDQRGTGFTRTLRRAGQHRRLRNPPALPWPSPPATTNRRLSARRSRTRCR